MTLILHGICEMGRAGPFDVQAAGCIALCSPIQPEDLADSERTEAAALAHHDRLMAARAHGDVLPIRFGAVFSGPAAIADHLVGRAELYRAALRRIAGAEEYTLTLTPQGGPPAPEASSGRDFLRARLARRDAKAAGGRDQTAALTDLADRLTRITRGVLPLPGRDGATRLAILVPEGTVEAVLQAAALPTDLFIPTLTGPWPAYSFSTIEPALA